MKPKAQWLLAAAAMAGLPGWTSAAPARKLADDLSPPVQIRAGEQPIDTDVGHAAPFVADMNGDGKRDLLVGQFGDGALRIYTNIGTNELPKFEGKFEWFMAGGVKGKVPFG
jgi:hypothetical protein